MTKEEIISILEYSEKYNIWNNPKRKYTTKDNQCEYCGKYCGKNSLSVHITVMGTCVPNIISEEMLQSLNIPKYESQGGFTIGSDCARKLFRKDIKGYTSK